MTTPSGIAPPAPDPVPTFSRTIERSLVHRAAVSEVLVTDLVPTGKEDFVAGAQLPLGHGYFSDHLRSPVSYDFLLLLEAARQAGTAASHRQLDIPQGTVFLVHNWSIEIDDPAALDPGPRPGELEMTGSVHRLAGRNGRLRGVDSPVSLRIGGREIGRARITVGAASGDDYTKLRFLQRKSTPPLTSDLGGVVRSRPADANAVGRRNPSNVVLGEPRRADGAISAQVEPRFENASLFDHTYDHIPAMVLTEAARQLAHLAGVPVSAAVTGCTADFTRFVELDAPLVATAALPGSGSLPGSFPGSFPGSLSVDFLQDGASAGRITLSFAPSPAGAAGSGEVEAS
ncbi:ScbA/BarX family gamma-butyrolactone biosynthesis protein [Streptomyces sp. NPDC001678]|uniref:ScbA/BarX family gamma-butyrolactone biosynthesis protein n=1 Tax=Streptomyces sp. NPDC001678 TaxID=3364599 RepID=UPI0036CA443D